MRAKSIDRHPEAHRAVERALKKGQLIRQPCEVCGATDKVNAHHDDYSKALDVRWLCNTHHGQAHRDLAIEAVGTRFTILDRMRVPVIVLRTRVAFGRTDALITPLRGSGELWISASRLID